MLRGIAALLGLLWLVAPVLAQETRVRVVDHRFVPANVVINEGETVRWVWVGDNHDVVSGSAPGSENGFFRSALENSGFEFEWRFDRQFLNRNRTASYRYNYFCDPHYFMGMFGSVRVVRSATNFATILRGWQVQPANDSAANGGCSMVLDADQTELQIECTHNVENVTGASLRSAALRNNGGSLCDLGDGSSPISATCPLTPDQVDPLFSIGVYVEVRSASYPNGEVRGQIYQVGGFQNVRGQVTAADGSPVSGVTITDGTRSAVTDGSGNYTLTGVPNGVYQLSASGSSLNIQPSFGTNPLIINNLDAANRNFTEAPAGSCGTDTDKDGVCDRQEEEDGTDPLDAGSYRTRLESPIQALWNGFIGLTNILEVVNSGTERFSGTLELYSISGEKVHEQLVDVDPLGQTDIVLNGLLGFQQDSYGIVQLTFDERFEGAVDGRVFFYRPSIDGEFEFAFGVPFERPLFGQSAVSFNTFQPSLDPAENSFEVSQWLSIVNLDPSNAKEFTIERRDMGGNLLLEETVTVAPFSRKDLEGGHVNPGPSNVGMHIIRPADAGSPYMAQLYRYGANAAPGQPVTSYSFAFPILARAGNGRVQYAPISVGAGASNWLEVGNASGENISVTVDIFDNSGQNVGTENFPLSAYAQRHLNVGALLPEGASGSARITPSGGNSIIGQSMFYFRDAARGNIEAMYGSAIKEPVGTQTLGSYNLFLGMFNWLKVTNVSSSTREFTITVFTPSGDSQEVILPLEPNSGRDLGIHDTNTYGTSRDSFSTIRIQSDVPGAAFSELLRIRPSAFGGTDFAAPTAVR